MNALEYFNIDVKTIDLIKNEWQKRFLFDLKDYDVNDLTNNQLSTMLIVKKQLDPSDHATIERIKKERGINKGPLEEAQKELDELFNKDNQKKRSEEIQRNPGILFNQSKGNSVTKLVQIILKYIDKLQIIL